MTEMMPVPFSSSKISASKIGVTVVNLLILAYLIAMIRRGRKN